MNKIISNLSLSQTSGNTLSVALQPAISLSMDKKYNVGVQEFTSFFSYPNIFTGINDTLHFTLGGLGYDIVYPQGLYDIDLLGNYTAMALSNLGLASGLFQILPNNATQHVVTFLSVANLSIQYATSSIRNILGYAANIGPGNANTYYEAPNIAAFNTIAEIHVHCSISNGLYDNPANGTIGIKSDIVAVVPINANIGEQLIYTPNNILWLPCITTKVDRINIYLTDQSGIPIIVNDPWTILLSLCEV